MSKQIPSETVSLLTDMFVKLCAINSMKMQLMLLPEEQQKIIKEALFKQWEEESQKLFDQRILGFQEQIKMLPPSERLSANLQVEKITDQFKTDIEFSKVIIENIV